MQMETTQHLKTTSKAHYVLHGTSLNRPKMDTRGKHKTPQVFHLVVLVAKWEEQVLTIAHHHVQLHSFYFCRTIVTKWTVGGDEGHQL